MCVVVCVLCSIRTKTTLIALINLGYTLGVPWEKNIAVAAGARLVPKNIPIAIAPIAIRLICLWLLHSPFSEHH